MSLTTRCPHCQTQFRIVPDQLRISAGWVRCGHCQQLFDARQSLQEVPASTSPATPSEPAPPSVSDPASAQPSASTEAHTQPQTQAPAVTPTQATVEETREEKDEEKRAEMAEKRVEKTHPQTAEDPAEISAHQAQATPETAADPAEIGPTSPENDFRTSRPQKAFLDAAAPNVTENVVENVTENTAENNPENPEADNQSSQNNLTENRSVAQIATELGLTLDLPDIPPQNPTENPVENPDQTLLENPSDTPKVADLFFAQNPQNTQNPSEENPHLAAEQNPQPADPAPTLASDPPAAPIDNLQFIRRAQRQARWTGPKVRFALGMAAIFLPLFLIVQIAWHERARLGAWQPALRPALEVMCVTLGCRMGPWRQLDAVVIVGSSFTHMDEAAPPDAPVHAHDRTQRFQLGLSLRNLSRLPVATPMLELTLTDASEAVILRRAIDLSALEFPAELPALSESNRSATLAVQGLSASQTIAGYHVILFYP